MYICKKCGRTIEELEIKITSKGYFNSYDDFSLAEGEEVGHCECGGKFVEARQCTICGDYFRKDEIKSGICEYCLEDIAEKDGYEYGLKIGTDCETDVYVNGLIPSLLSAETINKILLEYIEKNKDTIKDFNWKCEKYCREDLDCFAQYVEEKVTNG